MNDINQKSYLDVLDCLNKEHCELSSYIKNMIKYKINVKDAYSIADIAMRKIKSGDCVFKIHDKEDKEGPACGLKEGTTSFHVHQGVRGNFYVDMFSTLERMRPFPKKIPEWCSDEDDLPHRRPPLIQVEPSLPSWAGILATDRLNCAAQ